MFGRPHTLAIRLQYTLAIRMQYTLAIRLQYTLAIRMQYTLAIRMQYTLAIRLQYIHLKSTVSKSSCMYPTPQTMLGFTYRTLIHRKRNGFYKIRQLHHSYTTLYGERGRKVRQFSRNLQIVPTILSTIVAMNDMQLDKYRRRT